MIKKGDKVNYQPMIGGPVVSIHEVKQVGKLPSGLEVCWLSNIAGYVEVSHVSPIEHTAVFEVDALIDACNGTEKQELAWERIEKDIAELIETGESPLPLDVIPNQMGINLMCVRSLSWIRQYDGQLVELNIHFKPNNPAEKDGE